jgi:type IV secretory pathway TrbF-like protein
MNDRTFNEAKQLYLEQYASAIVTSGYLKIAVALLSLVVFGLVLLNLKTVRILRSFKPLVIRIDEIGRAQAVAYESMAYKPEYKETKYFLTRFCQLYYRRNRSTINDDFSQALYFLDSKLARDTIKTFKQQNLIKNFLIDSLSAERDIDVEQVVIEPMEKPPFRATVDFFEIEYSPADHTVARRTLYTASLLFNFRDPVPNEDILVNPLGLTITYFREDEAFNEL